MITKKGQKIIVWQLRTLKALTGANYFNWDPKQNIFFEQRGYIRFNSNCLIASSFGYPVIMSLYLLHKRFGEDGIGTGIDLASHAIGWVILSLVAVCQCVSYRMGTHVSESVLLINQLFQHSNFIQDMMISRELEFDDKRKQQIKSTEWLLSGMFLMFICLTPLMAIMITIPWEPNHAMIQDILEIDIKLQLNHAPYLIVFVWLTFNIGGVLQFIGNMIVATMQLVDICISCLTPRNVTSIQNPRAGHIQYKIETEIWGSMTDEMVISHVRCLQIIVCLTNKIYASLMISTHHLCCLVVFDGVLYMAIKMPDELIAGGIAACVFLGGIMILAALAQYVESDLVGENLQVVETFLTKCKNMTSKKSMFRKTMASVPKIQVELMYPFGSVGKSTFLQFCNNSLDNLITLLAM